MIEPSAENKQTKDDRASDMLWAQIERSNWYHYPIEQTTCEEQRESDNHHRMRQVVIHCAGRRLIEVTRLEYRGSHQRGNAIQLGHDRLGRI